jgi:hypothetical protein
MAVTKEYLQKLVAVLLSEGKEATMKQFHISEETLRRYMDEQG